MGFDVSVIRGKDLVCPKCGEVIITISVDDVDSGGRVWYPFLEAIGYYVPYNERTEENDWCGKDMKLTDKQVNDLYDFAKKSDLYNSGEIMTLIALARMEKQDVIINADW